MEVSGAREKRWAESLQWAGKERETEHRQLYGILEKEQSCQRGMWAQDKEFQMEEIIACPRAIEVVLCHQPYFTDYGTKVQAV